MNCKRCKTANVIEAVGLCWKCADETSSSLTYIRHEGRDSHIEDIYRINYDTLDRTVPDNGYPKSNFGSLYDVAGSRLQIQMRASSAVDFFLEELLSGIEWIEPIATVPVPVLQKKLDSLAVPNEMGDAFRYGEMVHQTIEEKIRSSPEDVLPPGNVYWVSDPEPLVTMVLHTDLFSELFVPAKYSTSFTAKIKK